MSLKLCVCVCVCVCIHTFCTAFKQEHVWTCKVQWNVQSAVFIPVSSGPLICLGCQKWSADIVYIWIKWAVSYLDACCWLALVAHNASCTAVGVFHTPFGILKVKLTQTANKQDSWTAVGILQCTVMCLACFHLYKSSTQHRKWM